MIRWFKSPDLNQYFRVSDARAGTDFDLCMDLKIRLLGQNPRPLKAGAIGSTIPHIESPARGEIWVENNSLDVFQSPVGTRCG